MLDEPLGALDRPWRERLLARDPRAARPHAAARALRHPRSRGGVRARRPHRGDARRAGSCRSGAAADVWRHPADEWTADFLGFGPAVDAADRRRRLAHAVGDARRSTRPVATGAAVRVVLRPDAVRLDATGPVRGTVVQPRVRRRPRRADRRGRRRAAASQRVRSRTRPRSATRSARRSTPTACSCTRAD